MQEDEDRLCHDSSGQQSLGWPTPPKNHTILSLHSSVTEPSETRMVLNCKPFQVIWANFTLKIRLIIQPDSRNSEELNDSVRCIFF